MALDENHPAVLRLVEKIAQERVHTAVRDALGELLSGHQ